MPSHDVLGLPILFPPVLSCPPVTLCPASPWLLQLASERFSAVVFHLSGLLGSDGSRMESLLSNLEGLPDWRT